LGDGEKRSAGSVDNGREGHFQFEIFDWLLAEVRASRSSMALAWAEVRASPSSVALAQAMANLKSQISNGKLQAIRW
jgi:hypothetical protein